MRRAALFIPSEFHAQTDVQLSSCEEVGHGILRVSDVSHPIVGVDVVDAEEVEAVESEPCVLDASSESMRDVSVFVFDQAIAHTRVHTFVCRCSEVMVSP